MSINERVTLAQEYFYPNDLTSFCKKVGIPYTTLKEISNGKNEPSFKNILKIIVAYPQISTDWLLKGEGEMLKGETSNLNTNNENDKLKLDSYEIGNKKNNKKYKVEGNHNMVGENQVTYNESDMLKEKIRSLEELVHELREDKKSLQKMLDFLQDNISKG